MAQARNKFGIFEEQKEGQFVNKLWYVHTMEYYAAVREWESSLQADIESFSGHAISRILSGSEIMLKPCQGSAKKNVYNMPPFI